MKYISVKRNQTSQEPTRATTTILLLVLVVFSFFMCGCGKGYKISTPNEFVQLRDDSIYDYRATTSDGLVIALRSFDNRESHGELSFWSQAIENELRLGQGYSLIKKSKVRNNQGLTGEKMLFGYDRDETAHLYIVSVFATKRRVFVLEAGGVEGLLRRHQEQIDWVIREFVAG